MTIDIDAIRQREQAATDGPWWAWNRGVGYVIAIGTPSDVDEYDRPQRELPEGMRTDIGRESDAEFIAHARTDIPALLAELAAAKAEHKVHNNACVEEKEDLRAELDRLRAVLAEAQRMAHAFDTPRDSSRVRVFVGDLRHVLHKGETQP